jgi:thiol-disulfide isomerase/thioredoxin
MSARLVLGMLACCLPVFVSETGAAEPVTAARQTNPTYYTDPNVCRGWFCYEDPALFTEPEKTPEPPTRLPFTGDVDWDAVWTMHPDDMRELINQALAFAQENPRDEQRMVTYLKLQGVAMQRAKTFQEAWSSALLRYPVLDATVQRVPTLAATTAEVVAEREDRGAAIDAMRERMGILYFYSPTCRYCAQQKDILAGFVKKWGWKNITAINVLESPEAAQRYGVQSVPDLWVAGNIKGETVQRRLKSGLVEFHDLERGLLKAWTAWNGGGTYERPVMTHQVQTFEDFLRADSPHTNNQGGVPK